MPVPAQRQPIPVILKGSFRVIGRFTGEVPEGKFVLRWSDPENPEVGIEAQILYDYSAQPAEGMAPPAGLPVKAIMVTSFESISGVPGFEPATSDGHPMRS